MHVKHCVLRFAHSRHTVHEYQLISLVQGVNSAKSHITLPLSFQVDKELSSQNSLSLIIQLVLKPYILSFSLCLSILSRIP